MICGIMNSFMLFKSKLITSISISTFFISLILLYYNLFISFNLPFMSIFFLQINLSLILDWLSLLFLSTVLFISAMIINFSTIYIPKNHHPMFLILLLMFVLSMSILIMSNNIIFILLGWDGLGLSSYVLVIYYQNFSSAASGTITILSNRIGDIMILMTISIMFMNFNWNFSMNENFPMITLLFLMIAAMSKSAQFPFSAWLPAAMSAPTPISALVHSSTLVTAGVYLMIRTLNFNHPFSMIILMLISSMTALYASFSALWEQDMKKIIALSTLSQMAMMMFAISLNSSSIAFFHLITHALFKSMMFLCAGILIHNFMYQDMRHMGSILYSSPITFTMLGISNASLMGIPFMSGFFSKDSIIENLIYSNFISILSLLMIFSISLTSMYSLRMMLFSSKFIFKMKVDNTFYSNNKIENPLIFMALFSISAGSILSWLFIPQQMFLIPFPMKMSILLSLISGMIISFMFSFNKKKYSLLGECAISLWFLHFISSNITIPLSGPMNTFSKNDKSWQEMYGPMNSYNNLTNLSKLPDSSTFTILSILIMITFSPIMLN